MLQNINKLQQCNFLCFIKTPTLFKVNLFSLDEQQYQAYFSPYDKYWQSYLLLLCTKVIVHCYLYAIQES